MEAYRRREEGRVQRYSDILQPQLPWPQRWKQSYDELPRFSRTYHRYVLLRLYDLQPNDRQYTDTRRQAFQVCAAKGV